jgi:hypothetical protein
MSEAVAETLSGLLSGIIFGTSSFFIVVLLSGVYRYFTAEKLSSFIGILFGLGFLGFSGGLLAILEQPTFGGVIAILAISIFSVWGVNIGDKIAEKIPRRPGALLGSFGRRKSKYLTVKLPPVKLIHDIGAKKKVLDSLKVELSEREFVLPSDLPIEEIAKRIRRRIITDWGIGDAQIEIDQDGRVIHFAISAKEEGLSSVIPKDGVAFPLKCEILPSNLASGDFVKVFLSANEVIEEAEVIGVDNDKQVITIIVSFNYIPKILGKTAQLVIALPSVNQVQQPILVKRKSGAVEEFQIQKINSSLNKLGVGEKETNDVVLKVKARLMKIDAPVTTNLIKSTIIEELEKVVPEKAMKLKTRKLWKL